MTIISSITTAQINRISTSKKSQSNHKAVTQDQVEISNKTTLMTQAEDIAKKAPEVDETAVAKAKEAIESGDYKIDYDKLAQKMLDLEFNLFDS